jgi:hypothetical protein
MAACMGAGTHGLLISKWTKTAKFSKAGVCWPVCWSQTAWDKVEAPDAGRERISPSASPGRPGRRHEQVVWNTPSRLYHGFSDRGVSSLCLLNTT